MQERDNFNGWSLPQTPANANRLLEEMFHHAQHALFHGRTMMWRPVRGQDGFAILQIPFVAVYKHFIIGKMPRRPCLIMVRGRITETSRPSVAYFAQRVSPASLARP